MSSPKFSTETAAPNSASPTCPEARPQPVVSVERSPVIVEVAFTPDEIGALIDAVPHDSDNIALRRARASLELQLSLAQHWGSSRR